MTNATETDTWLTINPGSWYHEACMYKGYCTSSQYLVINYSKWITWYMKSRNTGVYVIPPQPVFVGNSYEVVLQVASELNAPLTQTEMKG